jgi:hypothetical protein
MQTRLLTRLPGMTLAVMLMLVVAHGLGFGPEAQAEGGRSLEGTWLNAVKIVTCPPVPHVVIATFHSMTTYIRGGVLIEGGSPPCVAGGVAQCRARPLGAHGPSHLSRVLPHPQF